jgi:hypothetical protein
MMAATPPLPAFKHNRSPGRSAEFERLWAGIFIRAGWRLERQPKITEGLVGIVQEGSNMTIFAPDLEDFARLVDVALVNDRRSGFAPRTENCAPK